MSAPRYRWPRLRVFKGTLDLGLIQVPDVGRKDYTFTPRLNGTLALYTVKFEARRVFGKGKVLVAPANFPAEHFPLLPGVRISSELKEHLNGKTREHAD